MSIIVRQVGLTIRPHVRNGIETGSWQLDIPAKLTPNGQRRRKVFKSRKVAEEIARRLKRGLEDKSLGIEPTVKQSGMLFTDLKGLWFKHEERRVRTLKKKASSLEIDGHRLKPICLFIGKQDIQFISEKMITEYQEYRLGDGKSPYTVNSEVRTIMKMLRWARKEKVLDVVPEIEQIPERPPQVDIPTPEEVRRVN